MTVRKCSGFDPKERTVIIENDGKEQEYMLVMHRIEWFQAYCEETGKKGCIKAGGSDDFIKGPDGTIVAVRAEVYIDGELAASDIGDVDYALDKPLSCAATKAKGRALASAGFGIGCCGSDMSEGTPCDSGIDLDGNAQGHARTAGRHVEKNDGCGENVQEAAGNPVEAPAHVEKPVENSAGCAQVPGDGSFTLAEAKSMVLPMGNYRGLTLGEVYMKDPDRISFYADPERFTNTRYARIQEAARLILESA